MLGKIHKIINIFIKLLDEYFEKKACGGIDRGQLEPNITNSFYINEATKLSLEYKFIGPVLAISNISKQFLHWNLWTNLDSLPLGEICGDKGVCRQLLDTAGITQPVGNVFDNIDSQKAINYALALKKPCVIKPARGTSSSKGVSVNLSRKGEIEHAIKKVNLFNAGIIVEEFITGIDYRALVYKGKCLSIVERKKAQVTGNGKDSIKQLVEAENKHRISDENWTIGSPRFMKIRQDNKAKAILKAQNLKFSTILESGQTAWLSDRCNFAYGATYAELIDIVHPEVIKIAELAATTIGVNLAGVDIISRDITTASCYINEVNTTPSLDIHYLVENIESCKKPIEYILKEHFSIN